MQTANTPRLLLRIDKAWLEATNEKDLATQVADHMAEHHPDFVDICCRSPNMFTTWIDFKHLPNISEFGVPVDALDLIDVEHQTSFLKEVQRAFRERR